MNHFRLDIDEKLCWGCKTCEAACKQENRAPSGVKLIRVAEEGPKSDADGKLAFTFRVERCRHCDDPPCADACGVDAIAKRADGVVVLDGQSCVGCSACVEACPYGAITLAGEVALKCNLCHHRLDKGLLPACADNVCLANCISLGR